MKTKICFFGMLFLLSFQSFAQTEVEPNDKCSQANTLLLGEEIAGTCSSQFEKDFYSIEISESGQYFFSIVAPNGVNFYLGLSNDQSSDCNIGSGSTINSNNPFIVNISTPGIYYCQLSYSSDGNIPQDYIFKVTKDSKDIYECNNDQGHASLIQFGQDVYANILGYTYGPLLPSHDDVDYYCFNTTEPGIVTISLTDVPALLGLRVWVHDSQGNGYYSSCNLPDGVGLDSVQFLVCDPGKYYFVIYDYDSWPSLSSSSDLYHFKLDFTPDSTECNEEVSTATKASFGTIYSANIGGFAPKHNGQDYDYYRFIVNKSGNFDFKLLDSLENDQGLDLRLTDNKGNELWHENLTNNFSNLYHNAFAVCVPDTLYLSVESTKSPICTSKLAFYPYRFKVDLKITDSHECNNDIVHATKLNDEDTIFASFGSWGDVDVYKFDVNKGDSIWVDISNIPDLNPKFRIVDVNGKILSNSNFQINTYNTDTFHFFYRAFLQAGSYYIVFESKYTNKASDQLYKLIFKHKAKTTATSDPQLENLSIYPNPASENLTVSLGVDAQAELKLFSITGELINKYSFYATLTIPIKHLPKGLYIAEVLTSTGKVSKKVLIE